MYKNMSAKFKQMKLYALAQLCIADYLRGYGDESNEFVEMLKELDDYAAKWLSKHYPLDEEQTTPQESA